jgi:hypothetical protein
VPGFLRSDWLRVRLQIGLGAIFIAAAIAKILDPPTFAKNLWAYDLLPDWLINLQALFLPGIELVIGLALVLGLIPRPAAALAAILLVIFAVALLWNIVAGNPVSCSCFELNPAPKTCDQLVKEMWWVIVRDLAALLLAGFVIWGGERRRRPERAL